MVYFDPYLAITQGNTSRYFGIASRGERSKALYETGERILQVELQPITGTGQMTPLLAILDPIPNTAAARRPYRSVPDKVYFPSLFYVEGKGQYWFMDSLSFTIDGSEHPRLEYVRETDKMGNTVRIDRDGDVTVVRKAS